MVKNNNESNILTIHNQDGTQEEAEIIIAFENKKTHEEYVVYTKNEVDEQDKITIYASKVEKSEEGIQLMGMSDEEWERVLEVLDELKESE